MGIGIFRKFMHVGVVIFFLVIMLSLMFTSTASASTGDLISSSSTLVIFEIDRSDYGWWLSPSEANEVVQNKIIPKLQEARPDDYIDYFDSKPEYHTSQYSFEELIARDLMFHYNILRWDSDIGYTDWFISQSLWEECSTAAECDDGDPCTIDTCENERCNHIPKQCLEGLWCEEGECVPEASTVVLFATGLLLLAGYVGLKKRKTK